MTFLTVLLISFGLIFTAELGDKTQFMVLALTLRYGGRPVVGGAFLAFALLSGSAALIGKELTGLVSPSVMTGVSSWLFILFGMYMLFLPGEEGGTERSTSSARTGVIAAFGLIALSEMGDKTQIATLLLSVKYHSFAPVFIGSLAALTFASFLGVLVAGRLQSFIPLKYIRALSGLLFVLLGIGTLFFA